VPAKPEQPGEGVARDPVTLNNQRSGFPQGDSTQHGVNCSC